MCPAQTPDNREVLIRLIVKGDKGTQHLEALRRLATGYVAQRGDNHVTPVLQWHSYEDMTFAVFPLMSGGFDRPWFYDFKEILNSFLKYSNPVSRFFMWC
jgi:hypothetical protein